MTKSYSKDIQLLLKIFRNMIDHIYEKVNKKYLKAYIYSMVKGEAMKEVIDRINFCREHAED